jgi:hypothetical protein
LRKTIGPFLLLCVTPVFINVAALTTKDYDASFTTLLSSFANLTWTDLAGAAFPLPSWQLLLGVLGFCVLQVILFVLLPGTSFPGVVAPSGFRPYFRRTGPASFVITVSLFMGGSRMGYWAPSVIFDELLPLLTLLNGSALVAAVLLLFKYVADVTCFEEYIKNKT